MSKLSEGELKVFENILIQGGYVLDFNDARFRQLILNVTNIDVHEKEYVIKVNETMGSASKGKTLIYFCYNESESVVIRLLNELINYVKEIDYDEYEISQEQINKAESILIKYKSADYLISEGSTEEKIDNLIKDINKSIEYGKPQFTLDRLHTFMYHYIKELCDKHEIEYIDKEDKLDQIFSRYVSKISDKLESKFSKTILKQNVSIFNKFNTVRNNKSYAHDNEILNEAESLLVYRSIVNVYEFIKTIENEILVNYS